jgi:hypothetical protein
VRACRCQWSRGDPELLYTAQLPNGPDLAGDRPRRAYEVEGGVAITGPQVGDG